LQRPFSQDEIGRPSHPATPDESGELPDYRDPFEPLDEED
jgi:hypothetical protein